MRDEAKACKSPVHILHRAFSAQSLIFSNLLQFWRRNKESEKKERENTAQLFVTKKTISHIWEIYICGDSMLSDVDRYDFWNIFLVVIGELCFWEISGNDIKSLTLLTDLFV